VLCTVPVFESNMAHPPLYKTIRRHIPAYCDHGPHCTRWMEWHFVRRIDLDKKRVHIRLWLPFLRMTGHYKIAGRVLILPIAGSGYSEGNYSQYVCGPTSAEFSSNSLQKFFTNGRRQQHFRWPRTAVRFFPYFPHFLAAFRAIRYSRSATQSFLWQPWVTEGRH